MGHGMEPVGCCGGGRCCGADANKAGDSHGHDGHDHGHDHGFEAAAKAAWAKQKSGAHELSLAFGRADVLPMRP